MLSPYRINPNNTKKRLKKAKNTNFDNNSHRDHDLERPQSSSNSKKVKTKNNLKAGSVQKNVEINDQDLDEILDNSDLKMDLAMQIISTDKTVRNDTIQDLKEFNS